MRKCAKFPVFEKFAVTLVYGSNNHKTFFISFKRASVATSVMSRYSVVTNYQSEEDFIKMIPKRQQIISDSEFIYKRRNARFISEKL